MLPKLVPAVALILILVVALIFFPKHQKAVTCTNSIVFFGDSITAGEGVKPGEDFPSLIGKTLNVPIINSGVSGNNTHEALLRVDRDVLSKHACIVVIELGGNDLLEQVDVNVTKKNLDLILAKVKPTGAKIVILGIKFILFQEKYETDMRDLAKKYNAVFVPDILGGIITDPSLKQDDIHPNAKGYQKIVDKLIPIIAPLIQKPNN